MERWDIVEIHLHDTFWKRQSYNDREDSKDTKTAKIESRRKTDEV
jgi:hypothetical protein